MPALPVVAGIGAEMDAALGSEDFGPPRDIPLRACATYVGKVRIRATTIFGDQERNWTETEN